MPSPIKNIVFDLGGVIINIQVAKAFKKLIDLNPLISEEKTLAVIHNLNASFEIGEITESSFIEKLQDILQLSHLSTQEIIDLWNYVLLDIPKERIELIQTLSRKYRIFLLSNTNSIHLKGVNEILKATTGIPDLTMIFEKCYYSFDMKLRKPDPEIYKVVLFENNLTPNETLFIDDTFENTQNAALVGLKTIYLCPPLQITEALQDYV